MTKNKNDEIDNSSTINKLLTVMYAAATIGSMYAIITTYNTEIGKAYFQFKGWGMILFVIALVFAGLLAFRQKNLYDPWLTKKRQARLNPDERQLAVRRRVIERSYRIVSIVTFIAVIWSAPIFEWLGNKITEPFSGALFFLGFNITVFVISLPSLLAAWQRDS